MRGHDLNNGENWPKNLHISANKSLWRKSVEAATTVVAAAAVSHFVCFESLFWCFSLRFRFCIISLVGHTDWRAATIYTVKLTHTHTHIYTPEHSSVTLSATSLTADSIEKSEMFSNVFAFILALDVAAHPYPLISFACWYSHRRVETDTDTHKHPSVLASAHTRLLRVESE